VNLLVRRSLQAIAVSAALALPVPAFAHVSVASPAFAGSSQVLDFSVGHGCAGADTIGIRVLFPEDVASMRALPGPFGEPVVETSSAGTPLAVAWSKATARAADDQYYRFQIRIRVPDQPFTRIYFKVSQTCRSAAGVESVVEWSALPGEEGEPAADLLILPPRHPGWNKFMVPVELADLTAFDDAQIVWSGDAAYSSNPATMELIAGEPDVEVLTAIPAATEIWVKY
jgi:periplasmic copper chaperone A